MRTRHLAFGSLAALTMGMGLSAVAAVGDAVDLSLFEKVTDVQVSGAQGPSAIANVAVPVRLSASNIDYADFAADGSDLRVVDVAGNLLAHEIEVWDPAGESLVWVNIPSLPTGGTCVRFCHKATAGAVLPAVNAADVWNAKYAGVWHFADTDRNGIKDSAGKVADGSTPHAVTQLGEVGAVGKGILISNSDTKDNKQGGVKLPAPAVEGDTFTLSFWAKHRLADYYYDHLLFNKPSSSATGGGFALEMDNTGAGQRIFGGDGTYGTLNYDKAKMADWTHVTVVFSGAWTTPDGAVNTNTAFYVNGAYRGSLRLGAATFNTSRPFTVGNDSDFADGGPDVSFKGWMDEVRVSPGAMTVDEVATRHAAMAEPTFTRVLQKLDTSVYHNRTAVNVGLTKGESVANVPVLVRLSAAQAGFSYEPFAADGSDIRFADAEGHVLAHELVTWNTAGESQFWVMLPTLPASGATFYLYHNLKEGASVPAVDCSTMWKTGYRGVWHFDDADAIVDATGTIGAGAVKATDVEVTLLGQEGKIGKSVLVSDATDTKSSLGGVVIPNFRHTGRFTVSGWLWHRDQSMYYDHLFFTKNKRSDNDYGFAIEMDYNYANARAVGYQGDVIASLGFWNETWSRGKWAHVAYVYDGTNVTMYLNGESHGTKTITPVRDGDRAFVIGNGNTPDVSWKGRIDEVRFSTGGETACDIDAKYKAMADEKFVTLGTRETLGDGAEVYSLNVGYDAHVYGRFAPEDHVDVAGYPVRLWSNFASLADNACAHPAPDTVEIHGVYASSLGWTFPQLIPNKEYEVRVHLIDNTFTDAGKRLQRITVNGVVKAEDIDVAAQAGGRLRVAIEEAVRAVADANGRISLKVDATVDNAQVHAVEVVDPTGDGTPLKPVLRTATVTPSGTQISVGAQTGLTTYEIRRRKAGGAYETVATGRPLDSVLLGETGTDWLYSVRGTANGKTGEWSDEVAPRALGANGAPQGWAGVSVQSPARTVTDGKTGRVWQPHTAYPYAGLTYSSSSGILTDWWDVDSAVLKGGLGYGSYQYCVTNLLPSTHYTLRLYTGETYYGDVDKRQGYLLVNGDVWEHLPSAQGIDFFGHFGRYRMGCLEYETISDHLGRVYLRGVNVKDNNQFAAFELTPALSDAPAGAHLTVRNAQTNAKEGEILSMTTDALSFDWTTGAPEGADEDGNEIVLAGCVEVPVADTYTFSIEQNGNGFLYVDDVPLATVFGSGRQTASGSRELCAGTHAVRYRVNQRGGVAKGSVFWQTASGSIARQVVGGARLRQPQEVAVGNDGAGKWRLRHVNTYRQGADVYPIGTAPDNGSTRYRLVSTGVDFWTTNEHYPFFSQRVTGDGSLTVRLLRMQGMAASYTSFGLMMRTTDGSTNMNWDWCLANYMETGSIVPNIKMGLRVRGDADASNGRSVANILQLASADQKDGSTLIGINLPLWYRMTRKGTAVTMSWSRDGETWKEISTQTVSATDEVYVGLTALANASGTPEYEFDSLTSTFREDRPTIIFIR